MKKTFPPPLLLYLVYYWLRLVLFLPARSRKACHNSYGILLKGLGLKDI